MSNERAFVASVEYDYEGEIIVGVFGDLGYAKSQLIALDTHPSPRHGTGDTQHVRLFSGPNVEFHVSRSAKYRRVPCEPTGFFTSERDGWTDWKEEKL